MTSIAISDLFVPALSGVGPQGASATPASGTYMAQLLANATTLGMPTTSWEAGGIEREMIAIMSVIFSQQDAIVSIMAQGGFLDWAATGTVSYLALNGSTVTNPVTPDPSNLAQNPNGTPGWLDLLASSMFNVTRIAATFATQSMAIVNTTSLTVGPFSAGLYHVGNASTGATYANKASFSLSPALISPVTGVSGTSTVTVQTSAPHGLTAGQTVYVSGLLGVTLSQPFATVTITDSTHFVMVGVTATGTWTSGGNAYIATIVQFSADLSGTVGSSAPNAVTQTITANPGVYCTNLLPFVGTNWESNVALAARCRLKLGSLSPNGPAQSYQYFALTSSQLLSAKTPAVSLRCGSVVATNVVAVPSTGVVTVTVAGATPASTTLGQPVVEGSPQLAVTNAVSGTGGAVKLTVTSTTTLNVLGDWVTVTGVLDNANSDCGSTGTWFATVNDSTHITLNGSTFVNTYVSGGSVEAGDLGEIDGILRANSVPQGTTLATVSALAFPLTIVATVVVPSAQSAAYTAAATTAIQNFVMSLALGGVVSGSPTSGFVPYSDVEGTLFAAGSVNGATSYVVSIPTLTVNGGTVDLAFPAGPPLSQAILATFTLTLVKV